MHRIRLGYNAVPKEVEKELINVFRSGQYSPGPKCREFEEKFAKAHGAKHAVFVNSGTDALRLALLAAKEKWKWTDQDEVAVPAVTFPATVNTILQANLKPFFVDVSERDYLINPWNLKRRIETGHTRLVAMVPVHLFGQACRNETYEMAKTYKLKVIEDSCETILNPLRGGISCHSTYMAHHITTGVGGFASTNDSELRDLMWSYGNHGRREPGKFNFDRVGYSCRGTEFEAALGLSQMAGIRKSVNDRRAVFVDLLNALGQFDELKMVGVADNTCMMFPIMLKGKNKKRFCSYLEKNGIETRDMMPITNQPCYQTLVSENDYPVAKEINQNGFYIACHPGLSWKDVSYIRKVFERYLQKRNKYGK